MRLFGRNTQLGDERIEHVALLLRLRSVDVRDDDGMLKQHTSIARGELGRGHIVDRLRGLRELPNQIGGVTLDAECRDECFDDFRLFVLESAIGPRDSDE